MRRIEPMTQISQRRYLVRNVDAAALLQRFLVSGVAALLLLRFYLELTGFPQVGGGGLHIAHLLWGGLLMLIALVLLLAFLGRTAQGLAAVVGGIGFGLFIDEVGKFITSDNNYFFRPAVAIIYVVFVVLFLVFRLIDRQSSRSEQSYLVNALADTSDAVLHGFDRRRRDRALSLLDHVSAANPVASSLRQALLNVELVPDPNPGRLARLATTLRATYTQLTQARWFSRAVIVVFFGYAVASVLALAAILATSVAAVLTRQGLALKGDVSFSLIVDAMIVIGALEWRRSRLRGLLWFERAIVASILLVQPFLFYTEQLPALIWLAVDLMLFEALRYMIRHERPQPVNKTQPAPPARAPAT